MFVGPIHCWLWSFHGISWQQTLSGEAQGIPGSPGIRMVSSDWQNLREFYFPRKSGYTVCLSGLKGRVSAGDYREETIVKVKWDFVLSALFVCFYGHWGSSQLSAPLRPAASIAPISNVGEGESEKSTRSFPLIMCVYSKTVLKQTVLLVMTTALRGLIYCVLHIQ